MPIELDKIVEEYKSKKVCSETSIQNDFTVGSELKKNLTAKSFEVNNHGWKILNKKLSKSMSELGSEINYELCGVKRSEAVICLKKGGGEQLCRNTLPLDKNNKIARRRILNLLMLNAWRKQRQGFRFTQDKIEGLNIKLESFEMQVYVLRQLLNAEKKRLETANDNIHDLLQQIEEKNKEKSLILRENEELEANFNKLIDFVAQMERAYKNQENSIITARLEAENWEKQLEKEREKLKKMESEELFLKNLVNRNDKVIALKTQQIDELTQINKELQEKLDVQIPLWDESVAQVDLANEKLKEAQIVENELKKALEAKEVAINKLNLTIASLEEKLQEEDEKIGLLGKSVMEKTEELAVLQKKCLELSKYQYPWKGGIVRMASLCAKIPVACICTLGSLILPLPSYRLIVGCFE